MTTPFALGYGTNGFTDHPLTATLDVLEHEGYDAVALTLGFPHLDPFADDWQHQAAHVRDDLAARRDGAGMSVVIETGTRFLLDHYRKHRPTLVDREAAPRIAYMERAIDVAAHMGASTVSFFSGVLPTDVTLDEAHTLVRERVARLTDIAASRGVRLSLEPEPGMVVETVADALAVVADVGSPDALGVTVDVGHCLVVEPEGPVGALRAAAPVLANVQLDDMPPTHHEHRPFGDGEIDLPLVLQTLEEVGYTGIAAVELPRHSYDAPALARRSMTALQQAWRHRSHREEER